MPAGRAPSLTPDEARELHREALVIDTQQPPIASGIVFTHGMRETLEALASQGRTRAEAGPALEAALVRDIQSTSEGREMYLDMWRRSGVTVACGAYAGPDRLATAFERSVRRIANAQAIVEALRDDLLIVRQAADIERAHAEGKHGIVIDFQNTLSFGDDLDRIDLFHGLGTTCTPSLATAAPTGTRAG